MVWRGLCCIGLCAGTLLDCTEVRRWDYGGVAVRLWRCGGETMEVWLGLWRYGGETMEVWWWDYGSVAV